MIKRFLENPSTQISILFLICLSLVVIWFGGGKMYAGGEEGLNFYNLTKYLSLASYSWYEVGTGFQLFTLLPKLPFYSILEFFYRRGVDAVTLQAFTFFLLMFSGCLSVYFLIKETIGKELKGSAKVVPLLSGIFYLLNPYSMSQVWGRGIYSQFFAFALVPAFLLFFVVGLQRKNLLYALLAVFVSLIFSSIYTFPGNVLMLWGVAFLYLLFYIRVNTKKRKAIYFALFFFLLTLFGWVLTNLFWILPYFIGSNQQYSGFVNTEANVASLQGVSKGFPLPILIRLMHVTYFYYYYGDIYKTVPLQVISFFIPAIALFSLSKFKKLKNYKFYLILFLVSIFVNLGSNFPSGWFFELIFKTVPLLQMFRNPYEKLGLLLVLAYTPFYAIGLSELSNRIAKRFNSQKIGYCVMFMVIVLVHIVFAWPMWLGYFAGGFWANPWIKVPNYYKEADMWLQDQGGSSRLLQLPLNPGDGVKYKWEHPYSGIEPSEILFTSPSIGRNVALDQAKVYYNVLLERFAQPSSIPGPSPQFSDKDFRGSSLAQELERLGVGYIIFHRDIDTLYSGMKSADEAVHLFSKEPDIKKVETYGQLDIYKVGESEGQSLVFSPDRPLSFSKINPTNYVVNIKNAEQPFDLYFLQLFDEGWEASINGVKLDNHNKIYSYANSWEVDKKGDYTISIKYKPQEVVEKGVKISLYSTLALTLAFLGLVLRKYIVK